MNRKPSLRFLGKSKLLEVTIAEESFTLSYEFLRVHSPSAEVRGHMGSGGELPYGKSDIKVIDAIPVGNYGVRISFSDGHDSGIYSFDYLVELNRSHEQLWAEYLEKLHEKGLSRDPDTQVVTLFAPKG